MRPKKDIQELLKKKTGLKDISLDAPPDPKMGDFAFPCFELSKKYKKSPAEIAKELSEKIRPEKSIRAVESKGPYLNFYINKQELAKDLVGEILDKKTRFGAGENKREDIMIEFMSPNTNKSLHLGHVRNGALGEALSSLLKFYGYDVVKTCLNNDRGTGVAEAMLGYKKLAATKEPKIKPDHFVAECYTGIKIMMKDDPELAKDVQDILLRWEREDKDIRSLWKKMMGWVYEGYKETYNKLGVRFDKEYYESEIYKEGKDIVMEGLKKGIFEKQDGAIVAKFKDMPDKVLIKSDKTSLYITQDIYLARLKFAEFDINKSVYVVGSEQNLHFKQLFRILEMLDFDHAKDCCHLSYGLVNLPSGRMKSREGTVVEADDLIDSTVKLAKKEIIKRHKELSKEEVGKRAEIIGIGAIKFLMLRYDNATSFVFDPKEAISFEGETGPYVQYAYARIMSIFGKYGKKLQGIADFDYLSTEQDEKLIMLLDRFPNAVEEAAESFKPHLIARYLLDLAQGFNEFYHSCPILQEDEKTQKARLYLIRCTAQVLENGLKILGIKAPDEM